MMYFKFKDVYLHVYGRVMHVLKLMQYADDDAGIRNKKLICKDQYFNKK